jgi:hypothetical protein
MTDEQLDEMMVDNPGRRLDSVVPRAWCSGNTPAFQAGITGSSPVARLVRRLREDSAHRALAPGCSSAVAVRTHHLTLLDFIEDGLPAVAG